MIDKLQIQDVKERFDLLSYEKWCKENGVEPKKQKGFSQALIKKGYTEARTTIEGRGVRGFRGIVLV